jgi:hypothetical protein
MNNASIYGKSEYSGTTTHSPLSQQKPNSQISNDNSPRVANVGKKALQRQEHFYPPFEGQKRKTKYERQISEHSQLFRQSIQLTQNSRNLPLQHFDFNAENACDVYITDTTVFKPGIEPALKAEVAYGLMRLIGIEKAVIPSKRGQATVVSKEDKDDKGEDKNYKIVNLGNNEIFLVPDEELGKRKKIGSLNVDNRLLNFEHDGTKYGLIADGHRGYKVVNLQNNLDEQINGNKFFKLIEDGEGNSFLIGKNQLLEEELIVGKTVVIDGVEYKINKKNQESKSDIESDNEINLESDNEIELEDDNESDQEDDNVVELTASSKPDLTFQKVFENKVSSSEKPKSFWVNVQDYFIYDSESVEDSDGNYEFGGCEYEISENNGLMKLTKIEKGDQFLEDNVKNRYALVSGKQNSRDVVLLNSNFKEVLEESLPLSKKGDKLLTERNGQKYEVLENKNGIKVIGKDIKGMIQMKIPNVFTGSGKKALDVTVSSPEREAFYNRIPMDLFGEAFFATLLLRPQDGKISTLDETNVLFSALDHNNPSSSLIPILIDLDESMPVNNHSISVMSEITGKNKEVNPVRFGLMGFPHARQSLSAAEKNKILELIHKTVDEKMVLIKYLEKYTKKDGILNDENLKAFEEVIDKLRSFAKEYEDKNWNLQDLCFHVLPAYKDDWLSLNEKMTPEEKALLIGLHTLAEIQNMPKYREKKGPSRPGVESTKKEPIF